MPNNAPVGSGSTPGISPPGADQRNRESSSRAGSSSRPPYRRPDQLNGFSSRTSNSTKLSSRHRKFARKAKINSGQSTSRRPSMIVAINGITSSQIKEEQEYTNHSANFKPIRSILFDIHPVDDTSFDTTECMISCLAGFPGGRGGVGFGDRSGFLRGSRAPRRASRIGARAEISLATSGFRDYSMLTDPSSLITMFFELDPRSTLMATSEVSGFMSFSGVMTL